MHQHHPELASATVTNQVPPGIHGADALSVGDWIDCGEIRVTADMIDQFAELTGDKFEIHMADEAARRHGFDARVAHGLLVLSLIDGLKNNAASQFNARASRGWDWRFLKPVLSGDNLQAKIVVLEKKAARSDDQCVLTLQFEVKNQRDELVQSGTNSLLAYR